MPPSIARRKRRFGNVRQLKSGAWQARYTGPDGRAHTARTDDGRSLTFDTRARAEAFLERTGADIQRDRWQSPEQHARASAPPVTIRAYSEAWMAGRNLADRTRDGYVQILRDHIWPAFGNDPVAEITPALLLDLGRTTRRWQPPAFTFRSSIGRPARAGCNRPGPS